MNPGLVVKLRPSGPWRIGPDSGARNRVDVIYHSDSLFSAVTSAMSRMGRLTEWLDATARNATPAVCFGSCFPFIEEIGFVVPPRTVWPPVTPSLMAAHVRWKSARFIPLGMVQSILSGQPLDEHRWSVDGPSGCLVPIGRQGPFRTAVRWGAAVDRLSGASERHSTACIEFRPGAGLWTVIGFADGAARDQWQDAVKAAFRLLADTGFGGERSRGWGRSEAPEFIEGELPGMIIGEAPKPAAPPEVAQPEAAQADVKAPPVIEPLEVKPAAKESPATEPEAAAAVEEQVEAAESEGMTQHPVEVVEAAAEVEEQVEAAEAEGMTEHPVEVVEAAAQVAEQVEAAESEGMVPPEPPVEEPPAEQPPVTDPLPEPEPSPLPEPEPEPPAPEPIPETPAMTAAPYSKARGTGQAHWLLSLFAPAPADTVDWGRGSYTVLARGGRIDSPAGSGELKKQVQMVAEGSVLVAESAPRGAAPDVAPDGFAHPVFRAGFALAIPLPEGN